jgi:aspartate beta-hydroxylase
MDRYVLIVRFWHPELTKHERNGVRFLFDAFEDLSPEGLRRAQDNARARTKADAEAAEKSDAATESDAESAAAEPAAEAPDSRRPGGRKKNKRNKRKAASGSGDGLGLLAKGMK